jgi:hypothetical protein
VNSLSNSVSSITCCILFIMGQDPNLDSAHWTTNMHMSGPSITASYSARKSWKIHTCRNHVGSNQNHKSCNNYSATIVSDFDLNIIT